LDREAQITELERAIAALEAQRNVLGEAVVQAALEPLNQALESAPDSAEAWFALSQAQSYLGEIEAACDSLASFLDLSPPAVWIEQAETMRAEFGCPGESE